jgi:glutamine amidotransferase-like uncharacterized protein
MNSLTICVLFLTLSVRVFAWPESRLHEKLNFTGESLPAHSVTDGSAPVFALYIGKGTWQTGKEHLKMFFTENGYSYQSVTAEDIKAGRARKLGAKILVVPGGESWQYLAELGEVGASEIKAFVEEGGGYIGICAGAFYATSNREGGYKTGPYGIGLLEGTAYDGTALNTAPFIEGMMDFDMFKVNALSGLLTQYRSVLLGGPSFHYSEDEADEKKLQVFANFQKVDEPAMVAFQYGQGRVFLSGPHIEIEESRTNWGPEWADPDSEWPILQRVVRHVTWKD